MSKAKKAILNSYSDNVVEDHEDEEESGSYLGQADEDDNESEEEEEELESLEEEYEDEESDSDQEGDVESDGCSDEDEDEYYESNSDDESNEDDDVKVCGWKEGKPTDKDHCDKVVNLLRQRSKKLDVLKLEECKAYLRKHDLMISGTKETCIRRIIEHWRLKDGNGVRLYPKSSFTINCTGDACKGDVVMFKQRVYDKFNKVSRNGKVIGKRTIAGRVVKESYGGAKQQHTFTVEVLWSKGVNPLPSLYPLLVKGRNLYRYRTFRQRWANEADRSKVLEEKHRRGATARHVRASTKARVSAGSKRQRSLTDSKQHQIKRQKKPSEASTSGKKQAKTYNAKARVKYSSKKLRAISSSAKHSKKVKTKTSSYTNIGEVDQYAQRPSSQNIFDNSHPDLHQRNKIAAPQVSRERFLIPVCNNNHNAGHTVQLMNRGRNIRQPYSAYASQFDHRGHLSHHYLNSISPYDSRSSGHFFTPDFYDQRLKDGNGVRLYPKSSFTINCTGDVCKGDVVMFKQRVYDKFSKVSRNGKVIGKRTIAGRVVKESYGGAKQQHTFTVEVLWSKGVNPLPSLYPLLVKGRNLYRYRTFRQRWANEADRSKVLEEKHRRGATARHVRASTKARVSAGSKRQRSLTESKQHQIKRQKKPSEASTSGKKQPKTYNAKARVKYSSKKLRAISSSAKHSKKVKTKTSSYTNIGEVDQYAQRPSSQNIFDNSHPDLHQRNKIAAPQVSRERFLIPVCNNNHNAGHTVQLMNRGRNIRQPYSAYASQFDHRGHLSHHYLNSISPYDSRSSGHFFTPDFYDQRYAASSQFQGSNWPWPL